MLSLPIFRADAPEFPGKSLLGQFDETRGLDNLGKSDHYLRESPEGRAAPGIIKKCGQSPDGTHSSLDQFERTVEGKLAGIPREKCGPIARCILQQVVADRLFVAGQRHDALHDTPRRQLEGRCPRVKRKHPARDCVEITDRAAALANQDRQCIGGGQGLIDAAL